MKDWEIIAGMLSKASWSLGWVSAVDSQGRTIPDCVDLISDVLPFGRLWYGDANAVANAIGYMEHYSRSHGVVIRVYDNAGNVIETHQHKGRFQRVVKCYE